MAIITLQFDLSTPEDRYSYKVTQQATRMHDVLCDMTGQYASFSGKPGLKDLLKHGEINKLINRKNKYYVEGVYAGAYIIHDLFYDLLKEHNIELEV